MKEKTFDPDKFPTNELKDKMRKRLQEDPMSVINEWEKGRLKKIFKNYDKGNYQCNYKKRKVQLLKISFNLYSMI